MCISIVEVRYDAVAASLRRRLQRRPLGFLQRVKSSNVSELSPSFKDSSVLPGPGKCPEYDTGANESIFQWNPSA